MILRMSNTVVFRVIGIARNGAELPVVAYVCLVEPGTPAPPASMALFKTIFGDAHCDIDIYEIGFSR